MENLRRLLPSAASLIVFEAAGRHQNFTRAANELGMTQAAVSYAIRGLEEQLGVPLFHRVHRAVELTEAGEKFHADVSVGLSRIQKSAEDIRAKGRETTVTLAASTDAVVVHRVGKVLILWRPRPEEVKARRMGDPPTPG